MSDRRIRRVVIVGGGTAGWMAAAALGRFLDNGFTEIELVESDAIGTVGVGEATIPPIRHFLQLLRIPEHDFLAQTQGSYKIGIEFVDWTRIGQRYMHPFGEFGADIEGVPFHHFYLRHVAGMAEPPPIEDWSLTTAAARQARFGAVQGQGFPLGHWAWAYHFDAGLVAAYLRRYAERLGVKRTEGTVRRVHRDGESGHLTGVELASGDTVAGDLFLDCSGFRSLLLGDALGVPFEDWSEWLPCDRAVTAPSERLDPLPPFTRATAHGAGWQWRIPLQHRTGNGRVYASAFLDEDRASSELLDSLGDTVLDEPRTLSFTSGRRRAFWDRNCIALGLSAGFLEPLESTAIHLVQTGIAKLLALFPDRDFATAEIDEYNRLMADGYEQVRDFLVLHYQATERDDTEFWRHCRNLPTPEGLARKRTLFESGGRCFHSGDDLFSVTSWVAVMLGQGLRPQRLDEITRSMTPEQLAEVLERMRGHIAETARRFPDHADYLRGQCPAAPPSPPPKGSPGG